MTPVSGHAAPRMPWTVGQLLFWVVAATGGVIVLLVSWWMVGGQVRLGPQVPWLNAGVAGLLVAAAGNVLWLLQGRRAVAERTRALAATLPESRPVRRRDPEPVSRSPEEDVFVATPVMTRYHRLGCLLVAGRAVTPGGRSEHESAGRLPCGVCRP